MSNQRNIGRGITPQGYVCKHIVTYEQTIGGGSKRLTCACGQHEDVIPVDLSETDFSTEKAFCPECDGHGCSSCWT